MRTSDYVFVLCALLGLTELHAQKECVTPDDVEGICKPINKCRPLLDFIERASKPLSEDVKEYLREFRCDNGPNICCEGRDEIPVDRNFDPNADITTHPNIGLVPQEGCGLTSTTDKIIHGSFTSLFEFPWMALISLRNGTQLDFQCGATLINSHYVLTAAHCITNLRGAKVAGIRLGEYAISKKQDCENSPEGERICSPPIQDLGVSAVIPHPDYDPRDNSHDIGLVRLSNNARINRQNINIICLPIPKEIRELKAENATVTGWGRTEYAPRSDVLLKVDVPIRSHSECQRKYDSVKRKISAERHICAGDRNAQDSCTGDSGGPLQALVDTQNDVRYVQYGVVSFGPKPCAILRPGVYTKVSHYMPWILDNIRP